MVGDQPVVFMPLADGVVIAIDNVQYDSFGRVASYAISVTRGSSKSVVQVHTKSAGAQTPAYVAFEGTTQLPKAVGASSGTIGFIPSESGGIAARSGLRVQSQFSYDDYNRRQLKKQTFTDGGKTFEVSFKNFTRDGFGRLTSYVGEVHAK